MVTFRTLLDVQNFLVECGCVDLLNSAASPTDFSPSVDLYESWIKTRNDSIDRLKDFRRSQEQKANWRHNGRRILRGLKAFHRSTKGKRFHRNLARFMASRDSYRESYSPEHLAAKSALLNSLSSLKTQMYLHFEYYNPLLEDVDYILLTEEVGSIIAEVEKKVITNRFNEITEDEFEVLFSLISSDSLIEEIATATRTPIDSTRKQWAEIREQLIECKEYVPEICVGLNYGIVRVLEGKS